MNIWESLPKPFLILAPMEGVTDLPFRKVIAKAGRPDLFYTEFTNVSSYASEKGRHDALERLAIADSDKPIIAQIWGKNPDHFSHLGSALESLGFSGVDLNFGCPDKHVNKAGGGAAMIKTPDLAVDCYRRVKSATNLPVSIKTRLGWSDPAEFCVWLPTLLREHPAALTVHLRTRKEMSKVPAHYELIPEILALRAEISPETKLIINGDIKDRAAALALYEKYPEIDGFMIGRGVFQNPYCFTDHTPTKDELLELLKYHLDAYEGRVEINLWDSPTPTGVGCSEARPVTTGASERVPKVDLTCPAMTGASERVPKANLSRSYEPLKHYFKIYINNFPGASDLRAALMETHSIPEACAVLKNFGVL